MKQGGVPGAAKDIIQSYAHAWQGDDINGKAEELRHKLEDRLGVAPNVEDIRVQLLRILGVSKGEGSGQGKGNEGQVNLFKTFQEDASFNVRVNAHGDNAHGHADSNMNMVMNEGHAGGNGNGCGNINEGIGRSEVRRRNVLPFASRRKMGLRDMTELRSGWSLQMRLNELEEINDRCTYSYDKYDRKMSRKASFKDHNGISTNIIWFFHEYFYANYDWKYFQRTPLPLIYGQLGLRPGEISQRAHRELMGCLPKPRIFGEKYIAGEKGRLEQFRNECRQNTKNLSKSNEAGTEFPVHSVVLALHPMCGHLHTGSIMAYYKENLYMVRFHKPQLPTHKILDINMSTSFTSLPNKGSHRSSEQAAREKDRSGQQNDSKQGEVTINVNYEATAYLIRLLEFKTQLVKVIRTTNDKTDRKQNVAPDGQPPDSTVIFDWCVQLMKKLDQAIRETVVIFRLRGLSQGNSGQVFGNLKNLLLNPLKLMSKEFENSQEACDINATQQIKQIINRQRDTQIKRALNVAINGLKSTQDQGKDFKPLQHKMMSLINCCLKILTDLKYEGKTFDVQSNSNLIKLAAISGKQNSETFNQIYQRLFSIVSKVKQ